MKEIVIEEVLVIRPDAIKSTVVRWVGDRTHGVWVSTIPSSYHDNSFDTKAFRFTGYKEKVGKTARPDFDLHDDQAFSEWYLPDSFANDKEAAIAHHRNVAHEIADRLEAGDLDYGI